MNFSIKEKVAIAKQLEKWGISVIEAGFPAASPDSFAAVQEIAKSSQKLLLSGLARSSSPILTPAMKRSRMPSIHRFMSSLRPVLFTESSS